MPEEKLNVPSLTVPAERARINQAAEGDREALIELYRTYFEEVYRFVASRLPQVEDVEDITSEVFIAMVKDLKNYRGEGSLKGWLLGIARHLIARWCPKS